MGRTQRKRKARARVDLLRKYNDNEPSNDDVISGLYRYMCNNGWTNDTDLSVRTFKKTGRGICSRSKEMSNNDSPIKIPLKCFITIETVESDIDFKALFISKDINNDHHVTFHSLLAFYILYHKHLDMHSPIYEYIQSLPDSFATPYFCNLQEMQFLPENVLQKVVEQNRKIRKDFVILKTLFGQDVCDCCHQNYINDIIKLDDFKWAYFIVNTRSIYIESKRIKPDNCFFVRIIEGNTDMALAPFFDLFNHSDMIANKTDLIFNMITKQFDFVLTYNKITGKIYRYDEIRISYGPLTNFSLLVDYGFIIRRNFHDLFLITLADIEKFIKEEKIYANRTFHRNKFRFIRDHNFDDQMFVHNIEGMSHNLRVVLNLLFIEESYFPNRMSEVAFGAPNQLNAVTFEISLLINYKISEYYRYINAFDSILEKSNSASMAIDYMMNSINYLAVYLENL